MLHKLACIKMKLFFILKLWILCKFIWLYSECFSQTNMISFCLVQENDCFEGNVLYSWEKLGGWRNGSLNQCFRNQFVRSYMENMSNDWEESRASISCSRFLSWLRPRSLKEWLVESKYDMLNITFSWHYLLILYEKLWRWGG